MTRKIVAEMTSDCVEWDVTPNYTIIFQLPVKWLAGKIVSEMTYNWVNDQWLCQLNPTVLYCTVLLCRASISKQVDLLKQNTTNGHESKYSYMIDF